MNDFFLTLIQVGNDTPWLHMVWVPWWPYIPTSDGCHGMEEGINDRRCYILVCMRMMDSMV
jgi:hypothetical protein